MLGTLFAAMFGGPAAPWVVAAAVLSVFYVDRGGLRAVIFTDQIQFALMYGGFALLLGSLVCSTGAWRSWLRACRPRTGCGTAAMGLPPSSSGT
jgi:Na+/proline symporter